MTRPRPLVNIRPAPDTRTPQQREAEARESARDLARRVPRDTCNEAPPDDPPPAAA